MTSRKRRKPFAACPERRNGNDSNASLCAGQPSMAIDTVRGLDDAPFACGQKEPCIHEALALGGSIREVPDSIFLADCSGKSVPMAKQACCREGGSIRCAARNSSTICSSNHSTTTCDGAGGSKSDHRITASGLAIQVYGHCLLLSSSMVAHSGYGSSLQAAGYQPSKPVQLI